MSRGNPTIEPCGPRDAELIAEEAGARHVWLGVWERNEKAVRYYERQGFVEFDSHPFRFGSVEHTDLMMRREVKHRD